MFSMFLYNFQKYYSACILFLDLSTFQQCLVTKQSSLVQPIRFLHSHSTAEVSNTWPVGRLQLLEAVCASHDDWASPSTTISCSQVLRCEMMLW